MFRTTALAETTTDWRQFDDRDARCGPPSPQTWQAPSPTPFPDSPCRRGPPGPPCRRASSYDTGPRTIALGHSRLSHPDHHHHPTPGVAYLPAPRRSPHGIQDSSLHRTSALSRSCC